MDRNQQQLQQHGEMLKHHLAQISSAQAEAKRISEMFCCAQVETEVLARQAAETPAGEELQSLQSRIKELDQRLKFLTQCQEQFRQEQERRSQDLTVIQSEYGFLVAESL